jgi:colanic acid/amylovoran biosynthesis glycosyltransferase
MQNCDIIFQPSVTASNGDSEGGAPTILIEAQAAGMPVLSTDHADIPEIVLDGKTGLLAREGDVEDIAAKLQWLLQNRDKWREMGFLGREHVSKQHSIHDQIRLLEELYYRLILPSELSL